MTFDFNKLIEDAQPAPSGLQWNAISQYDGKSNVLLRDGTRRLFGCREAGVWNELLDGQRYPLDDFEPTEFATDPDDLIADYAEG